MVDAPFAGQTLRMAPKRHPIDPAGRRSRPEGLTLADRLKTR